MSVSSPHCSTAEQELQPQEKPGPGASWKAAELHFIPYNRLWIVVPGLIGCISLAALDQTIVATALPTIVEDLGEGKNYSWVGSAYLLTASTLTPLYGKLSDLIGRKPVLYSAIFIFLLGSALCGAAKSLTWLIICRGIQGIGGGGITQLVLITISDIVSLQDRGKYASIIGATWCLSSVFGPLFGGFLTDHVSWRWCFWFNLPTGCISGAILFFSLNLNSRQGMSLRQHLSQFDFIGLTLLMSGIVCVLFGLDSGETGWSSAKTIALLCVGLALLILAAINEILTSRSPIIPPRLFKTRTTGIILITCFLQYITYYACVYYLPLYYQVLGSSATGAGVRMIPFSAGSAGISVIAGFSVTHSGKYRGIIWASWAVMVLGWGLMTTLDDHSKTVEKVLYSFIIAAGNGGLFQPPLTALQAAMPLKDMATSTGTFGFLKTMAGTVGISIGQAIYTSILKKKINRIPDLKGFDTSPTALAESVRTLQLLPQPEKGQIIHAYAQSISAIWVFNTPVVGVGFIMVLFIKAYSLKRNTILGGVQVKADEEMTAGETKTTRAMQRDGTNVTTDMSEGRDQSLQEKESAAIHVIESKLSTE